MSLYVVGSLALGDYHGDRSDIDVVAAVAAEPTGAERSLLAEVHRVVATRVDGPYVPVDALAKRPEDVGPVVYHVDGRVERGACHEVSPVTWAILADCAVTVRGAPPADAGVRSDPEAVQAFSAANLRGYWTSWARTIAALIDGTTDDDTMEANMLEWGVLGVARVHCAAATGAVVSKRAGGEYARRVFAPEWHPVIELAIAARDREIDVVRVGELRRACAFVAIVAGE